MGAEMTATMIVWPRRCGHGGMVLKLVEHFRPYWLGRRLGRQVSAPAASVDRVLSAGLPLAFPGPATGAENDDPFGWDGRWITLLRYEGCIIGDAEIGEVREAGVRIEVVDVDRDTRSERSA
jgi:hypothetical protein